MVVWGEFGRTPKINKNAGRGHWPRVSCRLSEHAEDRPVTFAEVHATLQRNLGLHRNTERLFDLRGVPRAIVDAGVEPLRELV